MSLGPATATAASVLVLVPTLALGTTRQASPQGGGVGEGVKPTGTPPAGAAFALPADGAVRMAPPAPASARMQKSANSQKSRVRRCMSLPLCTIVAPSQKRELRALRAEYATGI